MLSQHEDSRKQTWSFWWSGETVFIEIQCFDDRKFLIALAADDGERIAREIQSASADAKRNR